MSKSKRDVALFVFLDKDDRILIQHRTDDAPFYPGSWSFFGGGVESGETALEALKREVKEELDYNVSSPKLVLTVEYNWANLFGIRYVFLERYDHQQKLILNEGQGMDWVSLSDMRKLKLEPYILETVEKIQPKFTDI